MKKTKKKMTAEDFDALPDAEKNRIVAELEAETPEARLARSRPLNAEERAWWKRFQAARRDEKRGRGRPRLGKDGVLRVSISVEASLLERLDKYAKAHSLNRSELFAKGAAALLAS